MFVLLSVISKMIKFYFLQLSPSASLIYHKTACESDVPARHVQLNLILSYFCYPLLSNLSPE